MYLVEYSRNLVCGITSCFVYRISGTGDIHLGETWVQTETGRVNWDSWDGNRWFSTETFGEFPYQTELVAGDGSLIGINFVLACTALQSMVIFIELFQS